VRKLWQELAKFGQNTSFLKKSSLYFDFKIGRIIIESWIVVIILKLFTPPKNTVNVDEKAEDKSKESFQKHLIFYKKLNKTLLEMEKELCSTSDEKIKEHLNDRIKAIKLDKERIKKLFPNVQSKVWDD
jgi:hypothetical protein